jgi:asparagine synthase (glutamine-hydrolysing)
MCGIAGLIFAQPQPVSEETVASLLSSIAHRGPDDYGVLTLSPDGVRKEREISGYNPISLLLAHHRLSILDLSQAGWQPMSSLDGQYHIVFNGEIYNYVEIKVELLKEGYTFESNSDTEVLLAAYQHWGTSCLARLVGMFAFAILDLPQQQVFVARDFFGIKPLYYTTHPQGFAFASEISSLLHLPFVTRRANPQRIYEYLRFGVTDYSSETLFADVHQLLPAHYLIISLASPNKVEPQRFWSPNLACEPSLSFAEAVETLKSLFLKNVSLHLRSDVPVGSALSGGIDSSSIVMAMRYLEPDLDIQTFSYIAGDPKLSEEKYCQIIGKAAKTSAHFVRPSINDFNADLTSLIELQGEPFSSTSIYAQYCVFRQAKQAGVKVMLDGQGADEILGGYIPFKGARLADLLKQRRWQSAWQFAGQANRNSEISYRVLAQWTANYMLSENWQKIGRYVLGKDLVPPWLIWDWFEAYGVFPHIPSYQSSHVSLKESLLSSLTSGLPKLLRYEDRNSMFFGIESRVPFLTPELVSFVFSLPDDYIVTNEGVSKGVFREAMRGIVPDAILNRKDKVGFETPERSWLENSSYWKNYLLEQLDSNSIPFLNKDEITNLLERKSLRKHSVWRWINLIAWSNCFQVSYE